MGDNINRRVLIIDDNRAIHEDFRKLLSPKDDGDAFGEASADLFGDDPVKSPAVSFDIDSAYQGKDGLEMVKQAVADGKPYGVAFVDVRMPPGWDGIETTARLWEICPELQVVICTAYSDYSWDDIARRLGHNDGLLILKKPFDPVEVLQLAETLAKKWTLAQQATWRMADLNAMVNQRTQELQDSNKKLAQEVAERCQAEVLLSAFSTLGLLLSATQTVREAGQIIVDAADRLLGWDACLVDLYSPDTDVLAQVLNADLIEGHRKERESKRQTRPPSLLARKALHEGAQLVLKYSPTGGRIEESPFGEFTRPCASLLCVPIRNGKTVTGLVSLQSFTPEASVQSLGTLQALADHCGGALDRIRTESALRKTQEDLRQSQKLEAIGQLAGGIAHDFNNLLAVIRGNADLGRMDAVGMSSEVTGCLDQISKATDRAANLTRQLLTFSRKQMMHSQPVDLDEIVMNLSKMLERIIGEDIALCCHRPTALPLVQADAGMLEQVLVNLVVNARDAMPTGGQLQITSEHMTFDSAPDSAHPEARAGDFVCLIVRDTGLGISPENMPHIFEPFYTTKEVGKGTGLGLATVYGIVKQHQGWIEVSSYVGAGTTFKIYLPALMGVRTPAKAGTPEAEAPACGRETVMLVEDDEALRYVTHLLLERWGYRVIEAGSGPEALKIWESRASEVDLLLTDVIMPEGITGRKLAEELLKRKPTLKVIFQSGYGGDVMRDSTTFLHRTNSCFLQKPCPPRDLLWAVRRCLDDLPVKRDHYAVTSQSLRL